MVAKADVLQGIEEIEVTAEAGPSLFGCRQREKKRRVMLQLDAALDAQVAAVVPGDGSCYEEAKS